MNGTWGVLIILGMFLLLQLGYATAVRFDTEKALRIYKVAACLPVAIICMVSYRICRDGAGYLLVIVVVILSSVSLLVRYVKGHMEAEIHYLIAASGPSSTSTPPSGTRPGTSGLSLGRSSFARLSDPSGKCDYCGTTCNRGRMQVACGSCSNTFQFQPACGVATRLHFACPFCSRENTIEMQAHAAPAPVELPSWWTESLAFGESKRSVASREVKRAVQTLMDRTWKNVATRDRRDERIVKFFEVVNVLHNENTALWSNYARARAAIRSSLSASTEVTRIEAKTSSVEPNGLPSCLGDLDPTVNECLLFHGTKPTAADNICKSHFMVHLAGVNKGTLYGPGIYFAENSSKADEYADDDKDGIYQGLYAMLLCRVTCGKMLVTEEVMPNREELARSCSGPTAKFHSVLGDREKARGTFREFVIFGNDQAYPEYVIIYRRVEEKPAETEWFPQPSASLSLPPPSTSAVPAPTLLGPPASSASPPPPSATSPAASAASGAAADVSGAASGSAGPASSSGAVDSSTPAPPAPAPAEAPPADAPPAPPPSELPDAASPALAPAPAPVPAPEDEKSLASVAKKKETKKQSTVKRSSSVSQARGSSSGAGTGAASSKSKRSSDLAPIGKGRPSSTASPRERPSTAVQTKSPSSKGDATHDESAGSTKRVSKAEPRDLARRSKRLPVQSSRSSRRGDAVASEEQAEATGTKV